MPTRLPHDHPSIDSDRIAVARHGGRRLRLEVPAEMLPDSDLVRLVLDESITFAPITTDPTSDQRWLTGAYAGPSIARNPGDEPDLLNEWLQTRNIDAGRTVFLDVIASEYAYGLREPGTAESYPDIEPPTGSLADIARSLDNP